MAPPRLLALLPAKVLVSTVKVPLLLMAAPSPLAPVFTLASRVQFSTSSVPLVLPMAPSACGGAWKWI